MSPRQESILRSGLFMTLSGFLFAAMGVLIRAASADVNNETVVFIRNFTGLLLFLPVLLWRGLPGFATQRPGLHLFRGVTGVTAMYCFFYAIAHIPLAEAMLFTYSAPLFVPLASRLWLREPISARTLLAVVIGFLGVVLVLKPGAELFRPMSLVGLGASLFAAIAFTAVRHLTTTEPALRIVFWFVAVATLISAVPMLWAWEGLSTRNLLLLAAAGVLATISQGVMSEGYRWAPAAKASPFGYSAIVFSAWFAWILWGEVLDGLAVLGAVTIFAASILILRDSGARSSGV